MIIKSFKYGILLLLLSITTSAQSDSIITKFDYLEPETRIDTLVNRSIELAKKQDYKESLQILEYCNGLSDIYNFNKKKIKVIDLIGYIHFLQNKSQTAIEYEKKAVELVKQYGDTTKLSMYYTTIGSAYFDLDDYYQSLEYYLKAYKSAKNNNLSIDHTLNNIGLIYLETKEYQKAKEYFSKSVNSSKDSNSISTAFLNIGAIYQDQEIFDSSIVYYNKALNYCLSSNKRLLTNIYNNLGETYLKVGKIDQGYNLLTAGIKIAEKYKFSILSSDLKINLSKFYISEKNYSEAEKLLLSSLNILETIDSPSQLKKTYYGLYEIFFDKKQNDKALEYYQKYINIKDSIENKEIRSEISKLKNKHETEQKDLELLKKNLELERKEAKNILLLFSTILTFIILSIILILYFYRKKSEKKIKEKNKILEETNTTKDKFFSIIAHDLKNPFTSILGATELLKEDFKDMNDKEIKEFLGVIHSSSKRSFQLLENLLNWSMSQTGTLNLHKEELHLKSLVDHSIHLFENLASEKSLKIENKVEDDIYIKADNATISTVFRNLINNAIKFTDENGKISIKDSVNSSKVFISVEDNGIGMTEKQINSLFAIEKNNSSEGTAGEKGTGLGLILCKEFIEKNDGKLVVESEYQKGTKFIISLEKIN